MTLWQENLERLVELVSELLRAAREEVGQYDPADYDNWRARSRAADRRVQERLERDADARFTVKGDAHMVRMASIRATSTTGWHGALGNWLSQATARLAAPDDPINLQGSGPAPIVPRKALTICEVMASGSPVPLSRCPVGLFDFDGTLALMTEYSSSSGKRDAYLVTDGEYFWGDTSDADVRAKLIVQPLIVVPRSSHAATSAQLRQRVERLTHPDYRVRAAEERAIAAEKNGEQNEGAR